MKRREFISYMFCGLFSCTLMLIKNNGDNFIANKKNNNNQADSEEYNLEFYQRNIMHWM